jgi:hypothetical protein
MPESISFRHMGSALALSLGSSIPGDKISCWEISIYKEYSQIDKSSSRIGTLSFTLKFSIIQSQVNSKVISILRRHL